MLSDATVNVAQTELQLAKWKIAALEAKAEQFELEMSSIKTLMQNMVQTIQGMQNIMSSNMATAITTDSKESPRLSHSLSPRSVRSSISGDSSSSEQSGPRQSSCMMKRDKHNKSRHYSWSPISSSNSESEPGSELESVSQAGCGSFNRSRLSRNHEQDPRCVNLRERSEPKGKVHLSRWNIHEQKANTMRCPWY